MRRPLTTLATCLVCLPAALADAESAQAAWTWPVSGDVITPYRNGTDPYAAGQHRGIDIAAPTGSPVVAAAAGEVRFAGTAGTSGLTISIRTRDGYDASYLHLSSLGVRAGAHVGAGERIGAVGTTGTRSATEPHLHFGVRDAGTRHAYHDPLTLLPPPIAPPRAPDPPPAAAPQPAPAPPAAAPAPVRGRAPAPTRAPVGRPAPKAAPAPVLGRAPAPTTAPVGQPAPKAAPVRKRAPAPTRAPVGRPAPKAAPAPVLGRAPAPKAALVGRHAPIRETVPSPARGLAPGTARAHRGARRAADAPLPRRASGNRPVPAGSPGRRQAGPDIGWALACAGLLLAAGMLGLNDRGRRATHGTRGRLRGALRPLPGGR